MIKNNKQSANDAKYQSIVSSLNRQCAINFGDKVTVDLFAGGGGASTGTELATGRTVDIAINHDANAISMHKANHPATKHYICDIYEVDPLEATDGRGVSHLHASPDCTHHSQASGGQPRKKAIRSLSWVVHKWAGRVRPDLITLENVEQILSWSPLVAKRCSSSGRVMKVDGSVAAPGERVPISEQYLVPNKKKKGRNWKHFVDGLRAMGYAVQWKVIAACDFGAPTTRARLHMVARCDGFPIVWPTATHAKVGHGNQRRWRTTGECIDWSLQGSSIFDRKKPLADATMTRIAKGIKKYIIDAADPYIAPVGYGAFITEHANASSQRNMSVDEPLRTICATVKGGHFGLVTAYLARHFGSSIGQSLDYPAPTIMTNEKSALVEVELSQAYEAGALRCAAFLMQYYSSGGQWSDLNKPMNAITTRDRMALVTVWILGDPWVVVDIRMRMLTPRELYRAQGFPESYVIERGHDGRLFTKQQQVRFVGNSVSPLPHAMVLKANQVPVVDQRMVAYA